MFELPQCGGSAAGRGYFVQLPVNYALMNEPAKTAILFPGQGSQRDGMRATAEFHCPDLLEFAISEIGGDPFELLGEGTAYQQPALYCASVANWRAAGSPSADFMVGHSLGELAAASAAGAISAVDGLRLAIARGRAMQDAAESDPGGMLAVLGRGHGTDLLAPSLGLTVANDNSPDQVVLSGPTQAIKAARKNLKEAGVRTVHLPVAGAFHSPAMVPAQIRFREAFDGVDLQEPRVTLVSSITSRPVSDLREDLLAALIRPVRWRETVLSLKAQGVRRFLETGPGDVLSGLVSRTLNDVETGPLRSAKAARV